MCQIELADFIGIWFKFFGFGYALALVLVIPAIGVTAILRTLLGR